MNAPLVSVVMPVYNAAPYLKDAIESILVQTFADFELLIFNDHSSDSSLEIINSYNDARIKLISYPDNMGIVRSLNDGIKSAAGKYIARMDADDISKRERLEKQVSFLESNKDVGVCGTWYQTFGISEKLFGPRLSHDEIVAYFLLIGNPIGHPSVMIRKNVLTDNNLFYDPDFNICQDYNLWTELFDKTKFSILPEVLLKYRVHEQSVSVSKKDMQRVKNEIIKLKAFERFFKRKLSIVEIRAIQTLNNSLYENFIHTKETCDAIDELYTSLLKSINPNQNKVFKEAITYWERIIKINKWYYLRKLIFSPLLKYSNYKFRDRLYYLLH
jgi:glycosyltransferase involved in cell wall biosynthesis